MRLPRAALPPAVARAVALPPDAARVCAACLGGEAWPGLCRSFERKPTLRETMIRRVHMSSSSKILTFALAILIATGFILASPAQAGTTYSGRAYAAFVSTAVTGPVYVSDT